MLLDCVVQYVCVCPGCVSACFTSCCVPNATESCVVNSGDIDMCSCDVGCFADDSCCFDILEVPCLPGEPIHTVKQDVGMYNSM